MINLTIVVFSLFLVQSTFAQCIGSRLDGLASIPNIPVEYLALGNYGAMDFLSSPILETQNILTTFPVASIPEVTCENIFSTVNPYVIDALSLELPYTVNTFPASFESCARNQQSSLTEYPFTNFWPSSPSIEFPTSSNYLRSPYELNSVAFGSPYSLGTNAISPCVTNTLIDTPVLTSPLIYEEPCIKNIPNYISPISSPLSTCAPQTATEIFSAPSALSRLSSFTPTNVKCLGGIGPANLAASRGGGLFVTSSSPIRPTGVSVLSENTIQGTLSVAGKLPFLGTVSLSETLPSFGYGTVNYNCGSGIVAMQSENPTTTAPNTPTPTTPTATGRYPRL